MRSVDYWPLAIDLQSQSGAGPSQHPSPDVVGEGYPPPEGCMSQSVGALVADAVSVADHPLGNTVGANGWPLGRFPSGSHPKAVGRSSPRLLSTLALWAYRRGRSILLEPCAASESMVVTWLILPVVICLSQRLSHACLSISNYTVKLRMAH